MCGGCVKIVASIQKRPDGRYRARYRDSAGKEHARHFELKREAQKWLDEVTTSVLTGMYVAPKAGRITFEQYAREWQQAQVWRPSTGAAVKTAINRLNKIIGTRTLESLTRDDVVALVKRLDDQYAPSTVTLTYSYAATILGDAAKARRIPVSPCVDIKLPQRAEKTIVPLTTDQVDALQQAMPPNLRASIFLGAGLGLRAGEALGLTEDRIDFDKREVSIDRQLARIKDGATLFGPPKTPKSRRVLPLPDSIAAVLREHLEHFDTSPDGLLFLGARGAPASASTYYAKFKAAAHAAGLDDVRFHDLRHHCASLLIHNGASVKLVQEFLGHKDATETLNTYAHLWPNSDESARAAIDAGFCGLFADYGT